MDSFRFSNHQEITEFEECKITKYIIWHVKIIFFSEFHLHHSTTQLFPCMCISLSYCV
jgi:hypothetical protein